MSFYAYSIHTYFLTKDEQDDNNWLDSIDAMNIPRDHSTVLPVHILRLTKLSLLTAPQKKNVENGADRYGWIGAS